MTERDKPQRFAIMVAGGPQAQSARLALRFTTAVLRAGHRVVRVFFYHDGSATGHDRIAADQWSDLAAAQQIDLVVCSAAAERRGLIADAHSPQSVSSGFQMGSLAQWLDAALQADRVVRFGVGDD